MPRITRYVPYPYASNRHMLATKKEAALGAASPSGLVAESAGPSSNGPIFSQPFWPMSRTETTDPEATVIVPDRILSGTGSPYSFSGPLAAVTIRTEYHLNMAIRKEEFLQERHVMSRWPPGRPYL
jgi:hypothetical protein